MTSVPHSVPYLHALKGTGSSKQSRKDFLFNKFDETINEVQLLKP